MEGSHGSPLYLRGFLPAYLLHLPLEGGCGRLAKESDLDLVEHRVIARGPSVGHFSTGHVIG